jgi:hypothetical protein
LGSGTGFVPGTTGGCRVWADMELASKSTVHKALWRAKMLRGDRIIGSSLREITTCA